MINCYNLTVEIRLLMRHDSAVKKLILKSQTTYEFAYDLGATRVLGNFFTCVFFMSYRWYAIVTCDNETFYTSALHYHEVLPKRDINYQYFMLSAHLIGVKNIRRLVAFADAAGCKKSSDCILAYADSVGRKRIKGVSL